MAERKDTRLENIRHTFTPEMYAEETKEVMAEVILRRLVGTRPTEYERYYDHMRELLAERAASAHN